jgi:hypothetical protein
VNRLLFWPANSEKYMDAVDKALHRELRKTEDAIDVCLFHIKRKQKVFNELEAKGTLSENEKIKLGSEREFIGSVKKLIQTFRDSFKANLGRMPASDVGLEQVILGAMMLEKPGLVVTKFMKPEHFYSSAHSEIYAAILNLISQGAPVDMRTVVNQLRKDGKLELIGGPEYIAESTAKVSSAANIEYHARIIIQFAVKRQMITMASEILTDAYDDTMDCFELLDRAEALVNEAAQWRKK